MAKRGDPVHRLAGYLLFLTLAGLLLPAYLANLRSPAPPVSPAAKGDQEPAEVEPRIRVYQPERDTAVEMPLERYVFGVVAAEVPAWFHPEALRAQAVAARTYGLRAIRAGQHVAGHPEAHVSSRAAEGQGWASGEELRRRWGWLGYWWWTFRLRRAIAPTRGEVLTYRGELIFPAYHSTSGGRTESSESYWGRPLPYLRTVESPFESRSPYLQTEQRMSLAEAYRRLGLPPPGTPLSPPEGSGEQSAPSSREPPGEVERVPATFTVTARSASGRVTQVQAGGKTFSGREVREKLGLRSTWFQVERSGDMLLFRVLGYGHGVGLSQYGAQGMAERGYTYREILAHYYPGTMVDRVYGDVR